MPSRRLGLSLGIDVVPYKICCYDCVYCQLGSTTDRTVKRKPFVDPDLVVREVEQALHQCTTPEVLTLAGSGEPTLYSELGEVARGLRRITELPLALLTNGGLLWDEDVLDAALQFDLVAPSLDAADPETFARVNRPAEDLSFEGMLDGLRAFCRRFKGRCRLEVMLVQGLNDGPASMEALARLAGSLERVEAVDLNSVVRPPACSDARGLTRADLELALSHFECAGAQAEIIVPYEASDPVTSVGVTADGTRDQVLTMIARRPCTLDDLCAALGLERASIRAVCSAALREGVLQQELRDGVRYYIKRGG